MSSDVATPVVDVEQNVNGSAPAAEALPAPAPVELGPSWWERGLAVVRSLQASTWFLVLAGPMGLFLVFAVPPFQGLDEPNHFYRAYTISQGAVIEEHRGDRTGATVPTCLPDYVTFQFRRAGGAGPFYKREFIQQPTACDPTKTTFVGFENTANYSPIPYAGQSVALAVGWQFVHFVPALFYAGRLAAFGVYLAVVFLALWLAPVGRSVLLLVGVWPQSLVMATTYSADGMTIALALLLVACVLRARHDPQAGVRLFLLAGAVAVALALSKEAYFVLAGLLLLVPARLFGSRLDSAVAKGFALALVALLSVAWYLQVKDVTLAATYPPGAIDPARQLSFIMHQPLQYARRARDVMIGLPVGYFTWETFVLQIGFDRSFIPDEPFPAPWMMVIGYCLLVQVYLREVVAPAVRSATGLAMAAFPGALIALQVAVIFTAVFVTATSSLPGTIMTVQGRYFLPLVAVPLISLSVLGAIRSRSPSMVWLPLCMLLVMYAGLLVKVRGLFY